MRVVGIPLVLALLAAACGGGAIRSPRMERDARSWVVGKQGRLRVDDGGSGGTAVVFVHGNGGNRTQWAAQLRHLRAGRRAVAFDLRGMGESETARNGDYSVEGFAEDVAAVADALGLRR